MKYGETVGLPVKSTPDPGTVADTALGNWLLRL